MDLLERLYNVSIDKYPNAEKVVYIVTPNGVKTEVEYSDYVVVTKGVKK